MFEHRSTNPKTVVVKSAIYIVLVERIYYRDNIIIMELRQSVEQTWLKILLQTIRMAYITLNGWLCKVSGQHTWLFYTSTCHN